MRQKKLFCPSDEVLLNPEDGFLFKSMEADLGELNLCKYVVDGVMG